LTAGGRSELAAYRQVNVRQGFTQYERDDETGLDYAQARYYANGQGRFISVDPLLASGEPEEPQSWNRYSYTLNQPLDLTDPSGMEPQGVRTVPPPRPMPRPQQPRPPQRPNPVRPPQPRNQPRRNPSTTPRPAPPTASTVVDSNRQGQPQSQPATAPAMQAAPDDSTNRAQPGTAFVVYWAPGVIDEDVPVAHYAIISSWRNRCQVSHPFRKMYNFCSPYL
jgi:RHS repeat-associated protein